MEQFGGGSWMMVSSPNSTAQDQFQQQQFQMHQQQFQVHQQQQQYQLQQQFQIHQQQQQQLQIQQQHQQQPQPQSLASHFQFLHLIESLAEAVESGTRDQHLDALVNELSNQFDKCQKLLNNISSSLDNKCVTVEGQKHKLEETEQLLNHRRELIAKYRSSVQNLLNSDGSI